MNTALILGYRREWLGFFQMPRRAYLDCRRRSPRRAFQILHRPHSQRVQSPISVENCASIDVVLCTIESPRQVTLWSEQGIVYTAAPDDTTQPREPLVSGFGVPIGDFQMPNNDARTSAYYHVTSEATRLSTPSGYSCAI